MLYFSELKKQWNDFFRPFRKEIDNFRWWREVWLVLATFLLTAWTLSVVYLSFFSAPGDFKEGVIVRVRKGQTISQVADNFYQRHLVRYPLLFKVLARLSLQNKVVAGDYLFAERTDIFTMVNRLTTGNYNIKPLKISIPEGLNSQELARLLDEKLAEFDQDVFVALAGLMEGRLWPDTYFIKPSDDEADIVAMMADNFSKQTEPLLTAITESGKSFDDILVMASIIELEARTAESRRMVSGILWNRIKQGMKLQVDAVFPFIMEKYSLQLTVKDLQFDSPYNTYKYKGLPPGPVCNPGLDSIKAALNPTTTSYLFYLSDKNGGMHYAKTYAGHMANRAKWLPNN